MIPGTWDHMLNLWHPVPPGVPKAARSDVASPGSAAGDVPPSVDPWSAGRMVTRWACINDICRKVYHKVYNICMSCINIYI